MEAVSTVIEYFLKGGFVMWPLLLCSVIVVSIAIERWLYYKEVDSGDAFADSYCNLLAEQKDADAGKLASCCKGTALRLWRKREVFAAAASAVRILKPKAALPLPNCAATLTI